jgi:hypothetical protein
MSDSVLSFASSSSFRNTLIARNLAPYQVQGAYTPPAGNVTYEVSPLGNSNVINSPDTLISTNQGSNNLYSLNEYGPDGGFTGKYSFPGAPLPVDPNQGPYYPVGDNSTLELVNEFYIDTAYIQNKFGPQGGYKDLVIITDISLSDIYSLPYWDPAIFVPSAYSPYEILTSNNPNGSNGPLSNDSFIARFGAAQLRGIFQDRVNTEIEQMTIGSINLSSITDPFSASLLATGQQPFFIKNWKITVPENPVFAAISFANRITGTYFPVSFIPGDYFDGEDPVGNVPSSLNTVNNLTGGALGPILNKFRNPSEIFLANTGNGQQSVLFAALDYNIYRPQYKKNLIQGVSSAVNNLFGGGSNSVGGYYVGSVNSEPSKITSPPNEVAVDRFGKQVGTIVYGPDELGKLYEGNDEKLNFGLKGKSYTDGGGIDGGFVWTSPKYKPNAGFKVGPGGQTFQQDNEFNIIESQYNQGQSTDVEYKGGSILDNTQRIIQAADNVQGAKKLKHVGNAINQVSKVFNDGYKEMTKGSQVIAYYDQSTGANTIGVSGFEVGKEYCRVFQKDTPYLTYADLQKTDGITTSGRKFTYSVFDNTYNLNIAPLRNPGSTNIVDGKVKKYMFSLENLAWRTSDQPGFTYDDLPTCEKGPNGGRIMWFPPYDISFSEDSKASWNPTSFLGRPEPIFTYKNSTRSGSLSWKIVVDSPASMNTIIEKQLANRSSQEINSIMSSFFAGCVKYDIYDLALKFNTIPTSELYTYQQILNDPRTDGDTFNTIVNEIPKEENPGVVAGQGGTTVSQTEEKQENTVVSDVQKVVSLTDLDEFKDYGFYFENDSPYHIPNPKNTEEWGIPGPLGRPPAPSTYSPNYTYLDYYNYYIGLKGTTYVTKAPTNVWAITNGTTGQLFNKSSINPFFDDVVIHNFETIKSDFLTKLKSIITEKNGTVKIELKGSASPLTSVNYNKDLSTRRINSVIRWFKLDSVLNKAIEEKKLIINTISEGEQTTVTPKRKNGESFSTDCRENILNDGPNGKVVNTGGEWYSAPAMACRRVAMASIEASGIEQTPPVDPVTPEINPVTPDVTTDPSGNTINIPPIKVQPVPDIKKSIKEGITKKILRYLFSECDYFEVIKETNPTVYDSFKDKIKYFNPAFHSMTPEGLNSRLTFLNQCMRPGQTIPVIGPDGNPKYNDALNTAFGAPPVLVLRIGDFYHSKIIPNGLSISYDPLIFDINPEGIGIQPMIAKVTLNFDFIGGQGLAGPVKQLQNALSFNYYGNTEIFDERSVSTENTDERDENIVGKLVKDGNGVNNSPLTTNQVQNQIPQKGGNTVGTILSTTTSDNGNVETGDIEYKTLMSDLSTSTQNYFTTIFNQLKTITNITNSGIMELASNERSFNEGVFDEYGTNLQAPLYGKSLSVEKKINSLVSKTSNDVSQDNAPIIKQINAESSKYSNSSIRELRDVLKAQVERRENELNLTIIEPLNTMTSYQETYNYTLRKLDVVCASIDGIKLDTGDIKLYTLSGGNGNEVISKITYEYTNTSRLKLINYDAFLTTNIIKNTYNKDTDTFTPYTFNNLNDDYERRFYMVMSEIMLDDNKYNSFVNSLITEKVKNDKSKTLMETNIRKYCEDFRVKCKLEHDAEIANFDEVEKGSEYKTYTTFKLEEFDTTVPYTTEDTSNTIQNKIRIKNLYSDVNVNVSNKTYNGKVKFS